MSAAENTPRKLPGSLNTNRRLDRWLRINRDGTVSVFPGKVEIGQGILTALSQIVAEELDVGLARVRLAPTDTSYSPDEGMTSGSQSITDGGAALRYAAAEARDLLMQKAATQLGVSLEQLTVTDGTIKARGGGSVTYWDIVTEDLLKREASRLGLPDEQQSPHILLAVAADSLRPPGSVQQPPPLVVADSLHADVSGCCEFSDGHFHGLLTPYHGTERMVLPTVSQEEGEVKCWTRQTWHIVRGTRFSIAW